MYIFDNLKFLLYCLIITAIIVLLNGCVKYKYVSVPCQVSTPERPIFESNTVSNLKKILEYTELLEASLKACK